MSCVNVWVWAGISHEVFQELASETSSTDDENGDLLEHIEVLWSVAVVERMSGVVGVE